MLALAFCGGGTSFPPGEIPTRPDAGATTAQGTQTFAIDTVFLGESDRVTKAPSTTAWKSYGYNLDGLVTTKDSTDVCTAAVKTNQIDGNDGIDNAFGSVMVPILQTVLSLQTPSDTTTNGIHAGLYTLQIQIDGLPDGSAAVNGMNVRVYRSLRSGETAPAFDQTTDWPVLASSLASSDLGSALWQTTAYIADDGTFVATMPGDAVLLVPVFSDLVLPIRHATITFTRSVPNRLDQGTIAGVIGAADLIAESKKLAGEISFSLCGSAFDGVAQQMQQASDMFVDGTNHSGAPCDAISIGIGFTATKIANPTQIVPDPVATDPCTAPPPLGPCTMSSVSSYAGAPLVTSKSIPGSCTANDVKGFWSTCLGPNAEASQCNALVKTGDACTSCLFSPSSSSMWGAIVTTPTTWSYNVAGCVALATGSVDCATSIAVAEGCESMACATCGYLGGSNPVDREQCIQTADATGCASWVDAECDFVAKGAQACRVNPSDEASFAAYANVFCGN